LTTHESRDISGMVPNRTWKIAVACVAAAVLAAGLTFAVSGGRNAPSPSVIRHQRAQLADAVTSDPATGTSSVSLDAPVTVSTRKGRILTVRVVPSAAGSQPLAGSLNPQRTEWTYSGLLAPSTTYLVTTKVRGRNKLTATKQSSFTTLTPTALLTASLWPSSGLSVGVGQPIVLKLSSAVTDPTSRDALLSHLQLAMSSPVPVGAYWFSQTELHLRPQNYWPSGENVKFAVSLDGWDAGGGAWGQGSSSVDFTTGDARISTANLSTHQMTVSDNGNVVASYPISAGSDQYPTMNGVHIVLDRESQVQMISSTVGIPVNSPGGYDETVYSDVHISDSGEYVHAAPWSVGAQGSVNVSHGCINLSPANAQQFFSFSRVGDIVNVVAGPRAPVTGDHGVMDWDTPWSSFTPVSVSAM
jgi:lipoprotein-anchoring transpeptidase ErfK/SrfK